MDTERPNSFSADTIVIGVMILTLLIIAGGLVGYVRSNPESQKLQATINSQKATIDSLQERNTTLQQTVESLQGRVRVLEQQQSTTYRLDPITNPTTTPYYQTYPTATPVTLIKDHQYDSGGTLRITGIYELADSVIYTTNTPAYSTFLTWLQPQAKTQSYMVHASRFDSRDRTQMTQGFGYQIKVYTDENDSVLSKEYFFVGNRTVLADPRCRMSKDRSFLSEYCPL